LNSHQTSCIIQRCQGLVVEISEDGSGISGYSLGGTRRRKRSRRQMRVRLRRRQSRGGHRFSRLFRTFCGTRRRLADHVFFARTRRLRLCQLWPYLVSPVGLPGLRSQVFRRWNRSLGSRRLHEPGLEKLKKRLTRRPEGTKSAK
jgi:hypothetical protein